MNFGEAEQRVGNELSQLEADVGLGPPPPPPIPWAKYAFVAALVLGVAYAYTTYGGQKIVEFVTYLYTQAAHALDDASHALRGATKKTAENSGQKQQPAALHAPPGSSGTHGSQFKPRDPDHSGTGGGGKGGGGADKIKNALDQKSHKQGASPEPDASSSVVQSTKSQSKSGPGWCFIGTERKDRVCAQVGVNDTCMSGQVMPTRDVCVHPKLRAGTGPGGSHRGHHHSHAHSTSCA